MIFYVGSFYDPVTEATSVKASTVKTASKASYLSTSVEEETSDKGATYMTESKVAAVVAASEAEKSSTPYRKKVSTDVPDLCSRLQNKSYTGNIELIFPGFGAVSCCWV